MALIKCPECGKEISDQADKCPSCGYTIRGKAFDNIIKKHGEPDYEDIHNWVWNYNDNGKPMLSLTKSGLVGILYLENRSSLLKK